MKLQPIEPTNDFGGVGGIPTLPLFQICLWGTEYFDWKNHAANRRYIQSGSSSDQSDISPVFETD